MESKLEIDMLKRKKVAIVDYQLSNLFSVKNACEHVGLNAEITSDPKVVLNSDAVVLPGVGAFGDAMNNLNKYGLTSAIKEFVNSGRPFMGVCLGMQLIFDESGEFGRHKGLGLIKGTVEKFPKNVNGHSLIIPQIGWNRIYSPKNKRGLWNRTCLGGIREGQFMYFVHSFYVLPKESKDVLATTEYDGFQYTSAILKNNIFAVQFHPEKSAKEGIYIYRRFSESI